MTSNTVQCYSLLRENIAEQSFSEPQSFPGVGHRIDDLSASDERDVLATDAAKALLAKADFHPLEDRQLERKKGN